MDSEGRAKAIRCRILAEKTAQPGGWTMPGMQHTFVDAASLRASEPFGSWAVRCGLRTRDRLAAVRFAVDDHELLAGRPIVDRDQIAIRLGGTRLDEEYERAEQYLRTFGDAPGQTGHCELDLARVLSVGLDGLRRQTEELRRSAQGPRADTYASFVHAVDGLATLIGNAGRAVDAVMQTATPERRAELAAMAESCRRIAHEPPQTFGDAVYMLWFAILGTMIGDHVGLVVPGHIDRTLYPFFRRDTDRGALTRERALELVEGLYFQINAFVPDGLAMSVMVGGRDNAGHDVTNELSYICLEALRRTRLVYPTVGVCWHEDTPTALVDLAVDLMSHGYSTPALFGDAVIQRGLQRYGVPAAESANYINSTCVEITPVGSSNVWVASPYFSTCRLLLEEIAAQATAGAAAASTFDGFLDSYFGRLGAAIGAAADQQNRCRELRRQHGGKPLQSVFTHDCLERGRDIDDGGARYNWVECSFVGLANLADSLHVIREEVYARRTLTPAALHALLEANFAGQEPERLHFLNDYPKYGNACPEVDALVGRVVTFVERAGAEQRMLPDNSPFVPGAFCWIMHERLGAECGATPDGRKAGTPFADGGGPAQGRERNGPTAGILSTTSWDPAPLIGGVAYNMKFGRSLFASAEGPRRLRDLLLTFLQRGGFEVQVNVVDRETLRNAQAHPEAHRDLVVRIGGYTDYFTRLSPAMQDEVMRRTEFERA